MWLGGKVGLMKAIAYIIAQLAGAVIAAMLLRYIFLEEIREAANFGIPAVNYDGDGDALIVGRARAFVTEVVLTFFLMYVITGVAIDRRGPHAIAALAIGLTITADILMGGPLTGAAMNPARHFGPALVDGDFKDAWIYWTAPVFGAALASVVQNFILIPPERQQTRPEPTEHH